MALGDLIASGLLYEGSDFAEWKAKVTIILRNKKLEDTIVCRSRRGSHFLRLLSLAEFALIGSYVSKELLDRVPDNCKHCSQYLLKCLAGLAAPFRFRDLPAELREMVYKMVLPQDFTMDKSITSPLPALIHASAQLRNETLPLFLTVPFNYYVPMTRYRRNENGNDGTRVLQDRLKRLAGISNSAVKAFTLADPPPPKKRTFGSSIQMLLK